MAATISKLRKDGTYLLNAGAPDEIGHTPQSIAELQVRSGLALGKADKINRAAKAARKPDTVKSIAADATDDQQQEHNAKTVARQVALEERQERIDSTKTGLDRAQALADSHEEARALMLSNGATEADFLPANIES